MDPTLDVAMKFSEGIKLKQFVYATQVKRYFFKAVLAAKKWLDPTRLLGIVGFVHLMADTFTPSLIMGAKLRPKIGLSPFVLKMFHRAPRT